MMADDASGRRYRPTAEVLLQTMPDGQAVLLHMGNEVYFGLDAVGARMWETLSTEGDIGAAAAHLLDEYDIDATTLHTDLEQLASELVAAGLLEVTDA